MYYFKDEDSFNEEMIKIKEIMERKGFVIESDHRYAYLMQYHSAFCDVNDWLKEKGYHGELGYQGYFAPGVGAVYGLYDSLIISYERMREELINEAKRQEKLEFDNCD
ncbi:MAG: hypothetical protein MR210_02980 [Erysipelotrichaceae bacterium]|nr:hypothetical protein [Erysipelotrichaceae bacterium]